MKDLTDYTVEELREAIEFRKRMDAIESCPQQVFTPDLGPLRNICGKYIEHLAEHGYELKDGEHYIYEAALRAIYGDKIFRWVSEQLRDART